MKLPLTPPSMEDTLNNLPWQDYNQLMGEGQKVLASGKYPHWDNLIHLTPPEGMSLALWWCGIKLVRASTSRKIPLLDQQGRSFHFLVTESILEQLHKIDLIAGGRIGFPERIINPDAKNEYYVSSLIEEALTSSQLEGAATTREVAKDMIRTARPPVDRSERMFLNNYRTMQEIGELKNQPLTEDLILGLHRLVTDGTLDDPSAAGRFRRDDEAIIVQDAEGNIHHIPPPASQLEARMTAMLDFANETSPEGFVHPVLRAIMLHFWVAYDHPFVDGNGRTARALFYWAMLHSGYWLCEYLSISRILLKSRIKYSRAFLHTESDGGDLTYFNLYHLEVLRRALDDLGLSIEIKSARKKALEERLQGMATLNSRQRAILGHAFRHPKYRYTIAGHQISHHIAYQTARTDLLDLAKHGLMRAEKIGAAWYFTPRPNLEALLAAPR